MQATGSKAAVSPAQLAESLSLLWRLANSAADGSAFFTLLDELGLSLTQMKALMILEHGDGPLTAGSRTVEALARRGWIARREDEHDRRVKRVSLTPSGRTTAQSIAEARVQGLASFAASLDPEQRERLHAVITDLVPNPKD